MTETATSTDSYSLCYFPISTVAELTGVNAITLRAWERRYHLFEPVRKASGHRLFTQEHIDLIVRVVGLLDRGIRIGQVKAHLEAESNETDGHTSAIQSYWKRYLDSMIAAVIRFDEAGLEDAYGSALALHPENNVTEKLLVPVLKELGRRWVDDEGSVAEEHFFGFYLRNKLGARFHHRHLARSGPILLLACMPGDRHETGLLLFALAASNMGYQTILLGADMPLDELPAAARKTGCEAIVLSGLVAPTLDILDQQLPKLTSEVEVPVFLGGRVSVLAHDALLKAGIHTLGTNLQTGLQRVHQAVPLAR